jgi:hypothetical protein
LLREQVSSSGGLDEHRHTLATPTTMNINEQRYVDAFKQWMTEWHPHAFVTINLPNNPHPVKRVRAHPFYLTCWTRAAEADLLGPRTLKIADFDRRIVWLFRREVSADGLVHYHAVVRFPTDRPWRDEYRYVEQVKGLKTDVSFKQRMSERPGLENVITRCARLRQALRLASSRTPEPFTPKNGYQPSVADIDVRPYDPERNHAGYLLKGMRFALPHDRTEFSSDDLLRDSGLIVLPHLPKTKLHTLNTSPHNKEPHR